MRFATTITAILVIALGYWAYHQSIQTQMADRDVERLQRAIGVQSERLSVLNAEWAYFNRPDRLRELAAINFERLELMPLMPEQFGDAAQIPFPPPVADVEQWLVRNESGELVEEPL